jgi:hypothetical protein
MSVNLETAWATICAANSLKTRTGRGNVAIAEMHDRKVKGAEAPLGHHFYEPTLTKQRGLHERGRAGGLKQHG